MSFGPGNTGFSLVDTTDTFEDCYATNAQIADLTVDRLKEGPTVTGVVQGWTPAGIAGTASAAAPGTPFTLVNDPQKTTVTAATTAADAVTIPWNASITEVVLVPTTAASASAATLTLQVFTGLNAINAVTSTVGAATVATYIPATPATTSVPYLAVTPLVGLKTLSTAGATAADTVYLGVSLVDGAATTLDAGQFLVRVKYVIPGA